VQRGTELGVQARSVMARGDLVPDDLVCDMVALRLRNAECERGSILDVFPRTAAQAGGPDAFLADEFFDNAHPGKSVPIVIPVDEVSEQVFREIESHSTAAAGRS